MVSIEPAFPPNWIPDDESDICFKCGAPFTMFSRKHHCRTCGKIFCAECSDNTVSSIPSFIHRVGSGLRLCNSCNMSILYKKKSKKFIFIFSLLPLHIKELEVLLYVNKEFKTAISCVISMFKAIQYKNGYKKWTGLERRLIQTHWREFTGHNRLMIQVFKSMVGIYDLSEFTRHYKCDKQRKQCSELYCDPKLCQSHFTPYDILELLYNQHTELMLQCPEIESWLGTSLTKIHPNWVIKFLPHFLQMGKSPAVQRIITNNILPMALDNIHMTYAIYFECELLSTTSLKGYYMAIQSRLMSLISEQCKQQIRRSHKLFHILENPQKLIVDKINIENILLPYEPSTMITGVDHANIKQIASHTRPWVIPLYTTRGKINLLQKNDDLRKDRLVITVMEILKVIDERLTFHTYFVFPLSCTRGWIEMIPNSKTVYDIEKSSTIQNYIISFNRDQNSIELRKKFMFSCMSNCVLGYMLGLGDRNLHNIIVCGETATMANIDFSYLLGYDPKNIESTEMKITHGMVDMLGGYDSEDFETLKFTCSSTYTSIRRHTYFWYALFRYLAAAEPPIYPHSGDLKKIQEHINLRLMPNATEEEVKVAIVKSVNSNSDSWKSSISDYAHAMKTNLTGLFNMEL